MTIDSPELLYTLLRQLKLLEPSTGAAVPAVGSRTADPRELAKDFVRRGLLTPYQVNQLFLGRGADLLLGSYVLLDRIGAGGMGSVFKARNWKLGTIVALKLIRKDYLENPNAVRRFQREVRAAAQLDHPNIVRALDADNVGGHALLVMEYVDGLDLAQLVKREGRLPVATACDYVRQAALGLEQAFQRGVVHRDVKPHNLLVTADRRTVKILDMGLAKLLPQASGDTSAGLTSPGTVLGTPDYLAPEQAEAAHTTDVRGDLYGLGCTLFFLITGQPPFPGGSTIEKLLRHRLDPPPSLASLRPETPPAVEAIVTRLLRKDPADRFQTPAELVFALEQSLSAPDSTEASGGDVTLSTQPAAFSPGSADQSLTVPAEVLLYPAVPEKPEARPPTALFRKRSLVAGVAVGTLLLGFALFASGLFGRKPPPVLQLEEPRGPVLDDLVRSTIPNVERFAWQPRELVAVLGEHRQRHWGHVLSLAVSPDGRQLASGGLDNVIRLWDAATMRELLAFRGHTSAVYDLAFSPDGRLLVSSSWDRTARLWDVAKGQELDWFSRLNPYWVMSGAFTPDGQRVLAGGWAGLGVYDRDAHQLLATGGVPNWVTRMCCTRDGKSVLALVNTVHTIKQLDLATGKELREFTGHNWDPRALAVSPDGRQFLSAGESTARLWDLETGTELAKLQHPCEVHAVAFTPDGRRAVTVGDDGRIRVWDLRTSSLLLDWLGHPAPITCVSVAPDGRQLYTGSHDTTVRRWDLVNGRAIEPLGDRTGAATGVAFVPDERSILAGFEFRGLTRFELENRTPPRAFPGEASSITALALARSGQFALTTSTEWGTIRVWDVSGMGQARSQPIKDLGRIRAVDVAPDGRFWVAAGDAPSKMPLVLWDEQHNAERARYSVDVDSIALVRFTADGKHVVAASDDGRIHVWDLAAGKVVSQLSDLPSAALCLATGHTSDCVVFGGADFLREWQLGTNVPPRQFGGPGRAVISLAIAPDDRTLVSAADDGSLVIQDLATGTVRRTLRLDGPVRSMTFARDGRHLATANGNGTVYVLRLEPPTAGRSDASRSAP